MRPLPALALAVALHAGLAAADEPTRPMLRAGAALGTLVDPPTGLWAGTVQAGLGVAKGPLHVAVVLEGGLVPSGNQFLGTVQQSARWLFPHGSVALQGDVFRLELHAGVAAGEVGAERPNPGGESATRRFQRPWFGGGIAIGPVEVSVRYTALDEELAFATPAAVPFTWEARWFAFLGVSQDFVF